MKNFEGFGKNSEKSLEVHKNHESNQNVIYLEYKKNLKIHNILKSLLVARKVSRGLEKNHKYFLKKNLKNFLRIWKSLKVHKNQEKFQTKILIKFRVDLKNLKRFQNHTKHDKNPKRSRIAIFLSIKKLVKRMRHFY